MFLRFAAWWFLVVLDFLFVCSFDLLVCVGSVCWFCAIALTFVLGYGLFC